MFCVLCIEWTTTKKPKKKYFSRKLWLQDVKRSSEGNSFIEKHAKWTKQKNGKELRSNTYDMHLEKVCYTNKKDHC